MRNNNGFRNNNNAQRSAAPRQTESVRIGDTDYPVQRRQDNSLFAVDEAGKTYDVIVGSNGHYYPNIPPQPVLVRFDFCPQGRYDNSWLISGLMETAKNMGIGLEEVRFYSGVPEYQAERDMLEAEASRRGAPLVVKSFSRAKKQPTHLVLQCYQEPGENSNAVSKRSHQGKQAEHQVGREFRGPVHGYVYACILEDRVSNTRRELTPEEKEIALGNPDQTTGDRVDYLKNIVEMPRTQFHTTQLLNHFRNYLTQTLSGSGLTLSEPDLQLCEKLSVGINGYTRLYWEATRGSAQYAEMARLIPVIKHIQANWKHPDFSWVRDTDVPHQRCAEAARRVDDFVENFAQRFF